VLNEQLNGGASSASLIPLQIVVLFVIVLVIETLRATTNRERKIGKK
jgi:hypothetical protein